MPIKLKRKDLKPGQIFRYKRIPETRGPYVDWMIVPNNQLESYGKVEHPVLLKLIKSVDPIWEREVELWDEGLDGLGEFTP